ncbi:MAG TPA: hypothetical protein VLE99_05180 [Candidatus Saccharimonadales bacterium]|nr:hypothetical protein [Candidatus Saccharimonadales bacterium]
MRVLAIPDQPDQTKWYYHDLVEVDYAPLPTPGDQEMGAPSVVIKLDMVANYGMPGYHTALISLLGETVFADILEAYSMPGARLEKINLSDKTAEEIIRRLWESLKVRYGGAVLYYDDSPAES